MTSDERVQIYVPSPQTTPYNTITKSHASLNSTSYVHLRTATLPWGTTGNVREDATPPPFAHRAATDSSSSFRSVTPLNNGGVGGGEVGLSGGHGTVDTSTTRFHTTSILETSSRSTTATTATTVTGRALEGTTEETSLEMVKISLTSTSSSSNAESSTTQQSHQTTASERTLMDDLPSLPVDSSAPAAAVSAAVSMAAATVMEADGDTKEPVSLSDIQLEES